MERCEKITILIFPPFSSTTLRASSFELLTRLFSRLSLLFFSASLCSVVYTAISQPRRILILEFMGFNGFDFDGGIRSFYSGNARQNVEQNYQDDVELWSDYYDLPPAYLLSLIILECGGQKPCGKRFEPKRFRQLKNLRDGKRRKFEYLRQKDIQGLSDSEIRRLSTSWGPFQIMGYHSIGLSKSGGAVSVDDLVGPRSVEIGVRWVDENYGTLLRYKRYQDAFHMHNTGRVYPKMGKPKTHDPEYVPNGLSHVAYFETSLLEGHEDTKPSPLTAPNPFMALEE